RLRFSGPKTSIICSPMTSLKTSIKTITYLSDIGCLEIQGASLLLFLWSGFLIDYILARKKVLPWFIFVRQGALINLK
ncbi:hypothetical protein LCT63_14610, partial [Escherichia coli]|uniref:hypothetical protein n=1 Tax=Escherichia coli TaxID=562 RepID=UPI003CCBBFFE|nr:hypothetical protein [Escherichia coli]